MLNYYTKKLKTLSTEIKTKSLCKSSRHKSKLSQSLRGVHLDDEAIYQEEIALLSPAMTNLSGHNLRIALRRQKSIDKGKGNL
jgi:hypothetical protein